MKNLPTFKRLNYTEADRVGVNRAGREKTQLHGEGADWRDVRGVRRIPIAHCLEVGTGAATPAAARVAALRAAALNHETKRRRRELDQRVALVADLSD